MKPMQYFFRRFLSDDAGNVLILTGLAVLLLVGIGGAGVDLGRQQLVRIKMQQAADAASLAGSLAPEGTDQAATALRYFNLNFPEEYLGVARPTPSISVGANVRVSASADMDTFFVRHIGTEQLTANTSSGTEGANSSSRQNYDLLLVMDMSGSMGFGDVGSGGMREVPSGLRSAVRQRGVDYCIDYYVRLFGYIDFTNYVACYSVPNTPGTPPPNFRNGAGIVGDSRMNAMRQAAYTITMQLLEDGNDDNESRVGIVTWADRIYDSVALTENATLLYDVIDRMIGVNGTNSAAGMREARRLGNQFNRDHVRAVVLLTDGKNTQAGTMRYDPSSPSYVRDEFGCLGNAMCVPTNTQSLTECSGFKNDGVLVYTIAFGREFVNGSADAATSQAFLRSCASTDEFGQPRFFLAPDSATLQAAFETILTSVKKVRIVE